MTFANSLNGFDGAQELLIKLVEQSPDDWATRKRVVQVLYDEGFHLEASKLVWSAPEIPPVTEEVVFTVRIVAMAQPHRAVRLISSMIETNKNDPKENLSIAKSLMTEGLVLQSLRFYGAATALDSGLVDDDFEAALVNADCSDDNWRDLTEADDFPWEGPRDLSAEELINDENPSETDLLLSGVTQRVPLMAPPQKQDKPKNPSPSVAAAETKEPAKPASAASSKTPEPGSIEAAAAASAAKVQAQAAEGDESFSSLVNFFKHKEMEQEADAPEAPQAPSSDKPATAETPAVKLQVADEKPAVKLNVGAAGDKPSPSADVKPASPEVKTAAESKPKVTTQPVPKPVTEPVVQRKPQETPAAKVLPDINKSSAAAQATQGAIKPVAADEIGSAAVNKETDAVLSAIEPNSRPERDSGPVDVTDAIKLAAEADTKPTTVDKPALLTPSADIKVDDSSEVEEDQDVSDMVADVLAERTVEPLKEETGGIFSSIKSIFRRSKKKAEPQALKPTVSDEASKVEAAKKVSTNIMKPVAAATVGNSALKPISRPVSVSSGVATPIARQPENKKHAPPRELDGRTQLVALAPQDGTVFFDQLREKYQNVSGEMPEPAQVALQDNIDYLQLIKDACSKDLNAFSKLLGLHSIMTQAGCSEWVNDMNLLRKGYGDAVLATVVSKYSVAECREILGAVYQRPRAQAAG